MLPVLRPLQKNLPFSLERADITNEPGRNVTDRPFELLLRFPSLAELPDYGFLRLRCAVAFSVICLGWQSLLGCARGSTPYPGILGLPRQPPCRRSTSGLEKAAMFKSLVVVQIRVSHLNARIPHFTETAWAIETDLEDQDGTSVQE